MPHRRCGPTLQTATSLPVPARQEPVCTVAVGLDRRLKRANSDRKQGASNDEPSLWCNSRCIAGTFHFQVERQWPRPPSALGYQHAAPPDAAADRVMSRDEKAVRMTPSMAHDTRCQRRQDSACIPRRRGYTRRCPAGAVSVTGRRRGRISGTFSLPFVSWPLEQRTCRRRSQVSSQSPAAGGGFSCAPLGKSVPRLAKTAGQSCNGEPNQSEQRGRKQGTGVDAAANGRPRRGTRLI
jgi:hypothetical protein